MFIQMPVTRLHRRLDQDRSEDATVVGRSRSLAIANPGNRLVHFGKLAKGRKILKARFFTDVHRIA
jgi:hypothetical protein